MKRGAERQLTKDEFEDGDFVPESTSDTNFKKAPDEILKSRIIRGLPNRTKPSGAQSNSTNGTTASSLFQSPPPSVASPPGPAFTFSPAAPTNSLTNPAALLSDSINNSSRPTFAKQDLPNTFGTHSPFSSSFSSTSQSTTPLTTAFTFPSSSDKPFAPSSTAKAFASVLNKSELSPPASSTPLSSSNQPAATDEDDPVLFQYYINLSGLNHSLLNSISKGIEEVPFADMSGILESYKSTYLRIQKEKVDASSASKPESLSKSSTSKSSPLNLFSAASSPFGKPLSQGAQSSFSTSGVSSPPSTTSTSLFSQPSAGVQPFGFPSSTGSKISNSSSETPTQSLFGVPFQKPSFLSPAEQTSSTTTTTSLFGSTSNPFKFGGSTTNQPSPSVFGPSTPATTFKWGATADQPGTSELTVASDSSSTTTSTPISASNNAVHFQFGSGSSGIPQLQPKTAIPAEEKAADDATDGEGSERATSTTEGGGESSESTSNLLASHNPHDDEGEGEENEISVHAIKVKAYRMKKADAKGSPGWADLGFGILRLKKDKDTNARRMLLRNSTNGKILINFKIYSGLKPSLVKKALTFVGHDNGVSQTYCVRLPGEEQAQQLKEALDQEIESVTVKDEASMKSN